MIDTAQLFRMQGPSPGCHLWHEWAVARGFQAIAAAGVVSLAFMVGCERGCGSGPADTPPAEPPKPPRSYRVADAGLAELLGFDADISVDPPAPAGNLKDEVDAFTTLDACVASRAPFDPVVGDAIDAIGYDSLRHDACRVLAAVKKRDTALCEPISSSSLRTHCEASVAIVAADEAMCPLVLENHDPVCVALARRDSRLCATALHDQRAMCRAILAHDASKCEGETRCERLVKRWSDLVSDAAQGPELGTRMVMTLRLPSDAGAAKARTFDLSKDVGPATVRKAPGGTTILIGDASTSGWPPAVIAKEARVSIAMSAAPSSIKQGRHSVVGDAVAFAVLAPDVATITWEQLTTPAVVDVDLIGVEIGAPVRFTLEASLPEDRGGYSVKLEVNTFVRDVVTVGR